MVGAAGALASRRAKAMSSQTNSGQASPAIKIVTPGRSTSDIAGHHSQLDHNFLQPSRSFSTTTYKQGRKSHVYI